MPSCRKGVDSTDRTVMADAGAALSALVAMLLVALNTPTATAQDKAAQNDKKSVAESLAIAKSWMPEIYGVVHHDQRAFPGYNLITANDNTTYLFDNEGRVVHAWPSETGIMGAYLLDNGHLFRRGDVGKEPPRFQGPGKHGRFEELDWDGNAVWDFEYISDKRQPHHDAIRLPNGNILTICWEMIEEPEAIAQGVKPEAVKESHVQPDCLVEIKPTGLKTGEVVWEWRSWDHLIQDHDRHKPNYGKVADHPERFDANYGVNGSNKRSPDWMHVNALAYNPDLDQIALSSPSFNEIWIIDHSTTTEEARGHTGGRWGHGGDILYRWGHPATYRGGTKIDQRLFAQHNIHWIAKGLPGEGHLLVFNNGGGREPEPYSSVDEFAPPIDNAGNYLVRSQAPFGPDQPLWSYSAPNKPDFHSWFISGAQRLPNGNTLINAGAVGVMFEVTPEREIVWKFVNPIAGQESQPMAPPGPLQIISSEARNELALTEQQIQQLDTLGKQLNEKLNELLSDYQRRMLVGSGFVPGAAIPAGEYLWAFQNEQLNLTEEKAAALKAIADEFNPQIAAVLTDTQKQAMENHHTQLIQRRPAPRVMSRNTLFRALRYGLDHPAFVGRKLAPGKTLVTVQEERKQAAEKK
ncbi:MAG: aryl-sulfate sulfotransferase [Pirellulales bacterium]